MVDGNGGPSLGELSRSQARVEAVLARMESVAEERHDTVLRQVSDVRHRVANLEAREMLSKEFLSRVGALFDRVEILEKHDIADTASTEALDAAKREAVSNKRWVIGIGFTLGGLLLAVLEKVA